MSDPLARLRLLAGGPPDGSPLPGNEPDDPLARLLRQMSIHAREYGGPEEVTAATTDSPDLLAAAKELARKEAMRKLWEERRLAGDEQAARLELSDEPQLRGGYGVLAGIGNVAASTAKASLLNAVDIPRALLNPDANQKSAAWLKGKAEDATAQEAAAQEGLAAASVDLPTPVAAAGFWAGKTAGLLADPVDLLPGGLAAEGVSRGTKAVRKALDFAPEAEAAARGLRAGAIEVGGRAAETGAKAVETVARRGNDAEAALAAAKKLQRDLAAGRIGEEEATIRLGELARTEQRLTDPHLAELQQQSLSIGAAENPAAVTAMPVDLAETASERMVLPEGSFTQPETPFQFNPHKLDLPDEVKAAIPDLIERNLKDFQARGSGVVRPWERLKNTGELMRKLGTTPEELLANKSLGAMTDEELAIVNAAAGGAGKRLHELTTRALAEPENLALKISRDAALEEWKALMALSFGGGSELARALNAQKRLYSAMGADVATKARLYNKYRGSMTDEAQTLLAALDPNNHDELFTFLSVVDRPDFNELLYTYWVSSVLSGVGTQGRNIIGNTVHQAFDVAMRGPEAAVESVMAPLAGRSREIFFKEAVPSIAATTEGLNRGVQGGLKAVLHGGGEGKLHSWSKNPFFREARYQEYFGHTRLAKGVKAVGTAIDIPFRGLSGFDIFARSVAHSMQVERLATRRAVQEGLAGERFTARVRELAQALPPDMAAEVAKYEAKMTFVDPPSPLATWFLKGRDIPVAGQAFKYVTAFIKIADRVAARMFEVSPLGFIEVGYKVGKGALRGRREGVGLLQGARKAMTPEISELTARAGVGSLITAGAATWAADGRITAWAPRGSAEKDDFYRVQHKKPWSALIGGHWVPFAQMEPLSFPLAMGAIIAQAFSEDKPIDDNRALAAGLGIANFLGDKSYLEGLDQLHDLMSGGYSGSQGVAKIYRTVSGFVWPAGLMRNVATLWDDGTLREPQDVWDFLVVNIPGSAFRGSVPSRLDARGQPSQSEPGGFRGLFGGTPIAFTTEDMGDLIDQEYRRLSVSRGYAGRRVGGKKLDDATWREYHQRSGELIDARLRTLMSSPSYWSASDEGKKKALDRIEREARKHVSLEMGL